VEIWVEGEIDETTNILVDFNTISDVIERFDHQVILNEDDPMVGCLTTFQKVITTPGDPTSEMMADRIYEMLATECRINGTKARISKIRVWESPTCCAERTYDD
jgi:6-pyruvoyltetrahydropterin/6-carboxytetrahydropterin synthase